VSCFPELASKIRRVCCYHHIVNSNYLLLHLDVAGLLQSLAKSGGSCCLCKLEYYVLGKYIAS
jgi:hypothetical protein